MSKMAELDMYRQHIAAIKTPTQERFAVAALIGECEAIASSGVLTEPAEKSLRLLIAETLSAFKMEPHQEVVKHIMEQSHDAR